MRDSGARDGSLCVFMVEALKFAVESGADGTVATECRDLAFAILRDLIRDGGLSPDKLSKNQDLDWLRTDPRFADLLRGKVAPAERPTPGSLPPTVAQDPGQKPPVEDHLRSNLYPLAVGNTWTYKTKDGSVTVAVVALEKMGGVSTYKLETRAGRKVSATENIAVKKDGSYRYAVNGLQPDRPLKVLALPATRGAAWKVESKFQVQDMVGDFVVKEEDVTVPAGTYAKATVSEGANMRVAGTDAGVKYWFAAGVGIVKLQFSLPGQDATLELEKFEPGPKAAATITLLTPKPVMKLALKIDGRPLEANTRATAEGTRVFVTPLLEPGRTYAYKIEATIEHNNYETITRTREVNFQAGEQVTVDLRRRTIAFRTTSTVAGCRPRLT